MQFCDSFKRQFPGVNHVELGHCSNTERDYYDIAFILWRDNDPERFWESTGYHSEALEGTPEPPVYQYIFPFTNL